MTHKGPTPIARVPWALFCLLEDRFGYSAEIVIASM